MEENSKLRKEIEILKPIAKNITFSFEKLQSMMKNQKYIFNKAKTSFNFLRKQKFVKNIFEKASTKNHSIKFLK